MSYTPFYPNGWQSGKTGGTPIVPEALQHMENGIINSAPGGFGLGLWGYGTNGVDCTTEAELDLLVSNGYFDYRNASKPLIEGEPDTSYVKGFISAYNSNCVTQIGFCNLTGKCIVREKYEKWGEWGPPTKIFGAAPLGFGLGEIGQNNPDIECTTLEALDGKTFNGYWAYRNADVPLIENIAATKYVKGHAFAYNENCVTQIGVCNSTGGFIVRERYKTETDTYGWSEWGWLNPAMTVGTEYRTTERWKGKAVYTALINMGKIFDSGATATTTQFTATEVFDFRGSCNGRAIPHIWERELTGYNSVFANVYILDGKVRIIVLAGSGTSINVGSSAYVQVWYTKD